MIAAREVSVRIGAASLVRDVTLDIAAGEVVALVGPNGAGKSTLLAVLAGDRAPCAGEVWLGDRPIEAWSLPELARRRAVLPQAPALAASFSALEVVMLGQRGGGSDALRRVGALRRLQQVELGALAGRSYPTLSGGERQRVQLARVLAQLGDGPGGVLLLDEPTASLDPRHQHHVLALARDAAARGHAVVVVLHDLNLAAGYADRVAVMHRGALVACGPPEAALSPATMRAAFEIDVEILCHPSGRRLLVAGPRTTFPLPPGGDRWPV